MDRLPQSTALMDPSLNIREQLLLRQAQQITEQERLTPRQRADLAKARMRAAMTNIGVKQAVRHRPYMLLGLALGAGMLFGAVPGLRRTAFKSAPMLRRALAFIGS